MDGSRRDESPKLRCVERSDCIVVPTERKERLFSSPISRGTVQGKNYHQVSRKSWENEPYSEGPSPDGLESRPPSRFA